MQVALYVGGTPSGGDQNGVRPSSVGGYGPKNGHWRHRLLQHDSELGSAKHAFDAGTAVFNKARDFIDARDEWLYEAGHIPAALSLAPQDVRVRASVILSGLAKDTRIITYCDGAGCGSSTELAKELRAAMGFARAGAFVEGWPAWRDAAYRTRAGDEP